MIASLTAAACFLALAAVFHLMGTRRDRRRPEYRVVRHLARVSPDPSGDQPGDNEKRTDR